MNGIYARRAYIHNSNGYSFQYKQCWSLASACTLTQSNTSHPISRQHLWSFTPSLRVPAISGTPRGNASWHNSTLHSRLSIVLLQPERIPNSLQTQLKPEFGFFTWSLFLTQSKYNWIAPALWGYRRAFWRKIVLLMQVSQVKAVITVCREEQYFC